MTRAEIMTASLLELDARYDFLIDRVYHGTESHSVRRRDSEELKRIEVETDRRIANEP